MLAVGLGAGVAVFAAAAYSLGHALAKACDG